MTLRYVLLYVINIHGESRHVSRSLFGKQNDAHTLLADPEERG